MIQENADQIWKFQRYKLVYEYVGAPMWPAPLCFISYSYWIIAFLVRLKKRKQQSETQKESQGNLMVLFFLVNLKHYYQFNFTEYRNLSEGV